MPKSRTSRYGKAIIGEEEYADNRKAKVEGRASIWGERVAPTPPTPKPELSGEEVTSEDASLSVKELKTRVTESPHLLDRQIDAEFRRSEGPRVSAVRFFLEVEGAKGDEAREEVVNLLQQWLKNRR
jgi:hypothetical protein